jgi:hypothetical protein
VIHGSVSSSHASLLLKTVNHPKGIRIYVTQMTSQSFQNCIPYQLFNPLPHQQMKKGIILALILPMNGREEI